MFGLHGIVVQTDVGEGLDAKNAPNSMSSFIPPIIPTPNNTFPPQPNTATNKTHSNPFKSRKSLLKKKCRMQNGHIVFSQVNIYNITYKCITCPRHSIFSKEKENCFCVPGFYRRGK